LIPKAEPGHLAAAYAGRTEDRRVEPDGRIDCWVRIVGVEPDRRIKNIVLTGPQYGHWESIETGSWWRLAFERRERQLACYFPSNFLTSFHSRVLRTSSFLKPARLAWRMP
jgi:hypothetical protein